MKQIKKLIRRIVPQTVLRTVERGYRKGRGLLWMARYSFPARGMKVIAVTGTNGKSTTVAYINEILKAAGYKTAALTTIFYEIAGKNTPNKTHFTIDRQSIVQNFFHKAKAADVDFVILEVTSHALDQERIIGVKVEGAVITNLTPEHLDYHKTIEEYAKAKSRLIRNYSAKWAVINRDDKWYEFFTDRALCDVLSVGQSPTSQYKITSVSVSTSGSKAVLKKDKQSIKIETSLLGEFNIFNATQAAIVGLQLNIDPSKIEKGIANLKSISGRMEVIKTKQNFSVIVDFAVTPEAIESALLAVKSVTKGKVRIVFGAPGDRDKSNRPRMGEVVGKNADYIYLTDDETYSEKSKDILKAVYKGIETEKATKKTKIIPDREAAIKEAINDAATGDTIIVTGLGHEDSRNMAGKLIPWSDQQKIKQILKLDN